jgi:quinol-cytochrome oxidoreductase complex cytochrome b subunit
MNETVRIPALRTRGHQLYQRFASFFSRIYSTELNPLYHLGGIAVFLFTVAVVSGIYVFLFYNVDPLHAYDSVENISSSFFNNRMRTVHRYSSDLLVIFILLHLFHTLITGKFKRMVSWISGVISFLVVIFIGITGFLLVWDQKAKLAGFLIARFFAGLPIFDPAIASAFLLNDLELIGGFFRVALFGHIFFSVLTVVILWIHVMKIAKPKIFPPRTLMIYVLIAIMIISIVFPVKSDAPAQQSFLPVETTFDWYYYFGYYLLKLFSVKVNWMILTGSGLLLIFVPYVLKRKKRPPAEIDLDKCDACNLCSYDCPYDAIDMLIHNGERKAILNAAKCVSCGICIGSCREHAITMPGFPVIEKTGLEQKNDLTVFSCEYFKEPELPAGLKSEHIKVPCIGSVLAKDVQEIAQRRSVAVALLSCEDCYYRQGKTWAVRRFLRKRPPVFSKKINVSNVKLMTISHYKPELLKIFLETVTNTETRTAENKFRYADYFHINHIGAGAIIIAFFLLMIPLSSTVVRFYDKNEKILVVSMKYVSAPTEYEKILSEEKHMQSKIPVVKKRSPVKLEITSAKNRSKLFEKEFTARGWRQDIAMFIYTEMKLKEEAVNVYLTETAFPDKKQSLENIFLEKGDGTFIILKDGKLTRATKELKTK